MLKVLIIEDEPDMARMISKRLESRGFQAVIATDGQEGINMANAERPDLIITDLAMPKMSGNIVVRILKESKEHKNTPIIMLSAWVNEKTGESAEIPADVYLAKPFTSEALLAKVDMLFPQK